MGESGNIRKDGDDESSLTITASRSETPMLPTLRLINDEMTPAESAYVTQFLSYHSLPGPPQFTTNFPPPFAITMHYALHVHPGSSNLYRAAILVLMSIVRKSGVAEQGRYLTKYRDEAQKCIDQTSLLELTSASYLIAIYFLLEGSSMQLAVESCRQFCWSLLALVAKEKQMDLWIEHHWRKLLWSVYYVHRDSILLGYADTGASASLIQSFEQWERLVGISYSLLPSGEDIANLPRSMSTDETYFKIDSVSPYLQYYLDIYLFGIIDSEDAPKISLARERLYNIADNTIQLVARVPYISDYIHQIYALDRDSSGTYLEANPSRQLLNVRDTAVALLYAFAHIVKTMLESTIGIDEMQIEGSAIAICRLCARFPSESKMKRYLIKRSLFWAGLILTPSKFPTEHTWIEKRLNECIVSGEHWRGSSTIEDEGGIIKEFFRNAHGRGSFSDIWRIRSGKLSLYNYTATLATWFFPTKWSDSNWSRSVKIKKLPSRL